MLFPVQVDDEDASFEMLDEDEEDEYLDDDNEEPVGQLDLVEMEELEEEEVDSSKFCIVVNLLDKLRNREVDSSEFCGTTSSVSSRIQYQMNGCHNMRKLKQISLKVRSKQHDNFY